jgi:hypothetical protein
VSRIRCAVCGRDPGGRQGEPVCIFVDANRSDDQKYRCRDHVSALKEQEIRAAERARGWLEGGTR